MAHRYTKVNPPIITIITTEMSKTVNETVRNTNRLNQLLSVMTDYHKNNYLIFKTVTIKCARAHAIMSQSFKKYEY